MRPQPPQLSWHHAAGFQVRHLRLESDRVTTITPHETNGERPLSPPPAVRIPPIQSEFFRFPINPTSVNTTHQSPIAEDILAAWHQCAASLAISRIPIQIIENRIARSTKTKQTDITCHAANYTSRNST